MGHSIEILNMLRDLYSNILIWNNKPNLYKINPLGSCHDFITVLTFNRIFNFLVGGTRLSGPRKSLSWDKQNYYRM